MNLAYSLAETAASMNEVPVGAVIVNANNQIISTGFNKKESSQDVTKHAEIIAIQEASKNLGRWRLNDCTLLVTLEPCLMCSGAIYQARLQKVIFATKDPKGGACGSLYEIHKDSRLNHNFIVEQSEFLREESSQLLKKFFAKKRLK